MANYYGTVDGFLEYCEANGHDVGDASPSPSAEVEAALLRGSVYIDGVYRTRFSGRRAQGRSQAREWPRIDATDAEGDDIADNEVPVEIVQATYEAAFRELSAPGSLMPDYIATERVQSEQVGPLSVTYATSSTMSAKDAWPVVGVIDSILSPLLGVSPSLLFGEVSR